MNAGNLLRASEASALNNSQFISSVKGKSLKAKSKGKKFSFSVMFLVTLMIAAIAIIFVSGNIIPSSISENLIEETDVQYADAVESKILVFQQAMKNGDVAESTISRLENNNVSVFKTESGQYALKIDGKEVSANDFYAEIHNNIKLYDAFNKATYGRAAYYFDKPAQEVFKRLGTNRNNYTADSNFDDVMKRLVGEGSNINADSVSLVRRLKEENGETKSYYEYVETGSPASSKSSSEDFINGVISKNTSNNSAVSTLKSAQTLNIADTISKEQKSSIFFLAFMENISKMKAGEGSESKINEAMSYLTRVSETEVVDINTGEITKVSGSPLESPSLYAVLSKEPLKVDKVKNYASDRVLYTIENKSGTSAATDILRSISVSTSSKINANIGNLSNGDQLANTDSVNSVNKTIDSSLIKNSFSDINGINAGEMLVEGAVNVGKELAKASGATPGSDDAVKNYARLTSKILAMDAEVDRMNRNPFDITSKNTFLGSIVYNFAIHLKPTSFISQVSSFSNTISSSILSLLPTTYADDETTRYLGSFGECKTINSIGAVGSATCSEIATFDTSTLEGIYDDPGFIDFVNKNTTISNNTRIINAGSILDMFVNYNNKRITPIGVMDGGILNSLKSGLFSIPGLSSIADMIKNTENSNESEKRIATGEAFVNSSSNADWQTYKYAQRYMSLARATEAFKQFSEDETAYSSLDTLALSQH
jgi:hypothetical protein